MSTILLVEDDEQLRTMLKEILTNSGHDVLEAADGNKVEAICQQHALDLVITDLLMPHKEGLEVIMDLRSKYPDVRIIAISGGGTGDPDSYLAMAQRLGANRTLAKPFTPREILGAVESVLKSGG